VRQAGLHDLAELVAPSVAVSTPYITITIKVQIFVDVPPVVRCMMRITFIFHAFGEGARATADVAVIPRSHGMLTASAVAVG
jgi:hypothetical protein